MNSFSFATKSIRFAGLSLAALALPALFVSSLDAQTVPQLINYQGRIAVGGANYSGSGSFKFALVNANGSQTYWSNDGSSTAGSQPAAAVTLAVANGLYSALLGDASLPNMTAIPATVFANADVRLRVWFNDGANGFQLLTPDQRIGAVAYALMADGVKSGGVTSAMIASGAVTSAQIASGAVGSTQLASGAVGSAQLGAGAVQSGNLAGGAVGAAQLASNAVSGEFWTPTSGAAGVPSPRVDHTAVWTGSEMIVWGGQTNAGPANDGARYNPALNTWTALGATGAPVARSRHAAVWSGSEMLAWGGSGASGPLNDGGRYSPATNAWTAMTTTGAPVPRYSPTSIWTGSEMIVWGGGTGGGMQGVTRYNDGGRYNPATNSWMATNLSGAPTVRYIHTAVWTGTRMIIWGGLSASFTNTGALYDPTTNAWTPTNLAGAPVARSGHTAVWTGSRMVVFGGSDGNTALSSGGRYDPVTDTWSATASSIAPRTAHTAVWSGQEMVVWGGANTTQLNTGERYNPATDRWASLTLSGAPQARSSHTAVWAGTEMIVWGGVFSASLLGDGARLRLSNILAASIGGTELNNPLQLSSAASGSALVGTNSNASGVGITGIGTGGFNSTGVSGSGGSGTGVSGDATTGTGVLGTSPSGNGVVGTTVDGVGVFGASSGSGYAGRFNGDVLVTGALQAQATGLIGVVGGTNAGVEGSGFFSGTGVLGTASGNSSNPGKGIAGTGGSGGYGIYGYNSFNAGYFAGAVTVTGLLTKPGGSFRIDHPLDPANKYLSHSFVESPDMMNLYNGNAVLDDRGEATVTLPEWFGALNKEFRYQLTCLGGFAPVYVAEEVANNRFKIAGGKPGLKVSWQVTGIRQDAWANAHRIPVEEDKPKEERGYYIHPTLYGQPPQKSLEWLRHPDLLRATVAPTEDGGQPSAPTK